MAANRRKPEKVNVNAWVDKELKERFQKIAQARGVSLSQLLLELLEQEVTKNHQSESNGTDQPGPRGSDPTADES